MDTGAVNASASKVLGPTPKNDKARLTKAAEGFEAQWFQQVMSEAKSAYGKKDSFATDTFRGMMNESMSRSMAETHTLGLADMIVRQLQSHITPAHGTDAASAEATSPATETAALQPEMPQ